MIRLVSKFLTPCLLLFIVPAASLATKGVLIQHPAGDLVAPAFDFENRPTYKPCGNEIVFSYDNNNEGAGTEIWRSRSADSGFERIALKHGENVFIDQDLGSNKTYYYKLRAITDDAVSEFSEVAGFESGASWFDPALRLTLLDDQTVEGKITDRSFLEYNYQLSFRMEGGASEELYRNIMLSDSGQTFTFTHRSLEPGKTYIYSVDATLGWSCGSRLYSNVAVDTITLPGNGQPELVVPEFVGVWPGTDPCGNEIAFTIRNSNPDADTEIWRSRYPDSGFQLIDVGRLGSAYLDDSLGSRKEYYYKLRAVTATDTSDFSDTHKFFSGPKWFEPTLELSVLPDNTVQGKFTDHSYLDDAYDFSRSGDGKSSLFHAGVALPDSGRVFTFVDTAVHAGGTYTYHVDLYYCRANLRTDILVKSITVPGDEEELLAPAFIDVGSGYEPCGNELVFVFGNDNADAATEIWRSRNAEAGFELVDVRQHAGTYIDDSLGSSKDYYYKLRAVTASDTSAFSETRMYSSGPQWFEPILELSVLPDQTVQGTLTDRSYLDDSYEVYRIHDFYSSAVLTDSGRVHTFVDTFVMPGETYTYHVDLYYCYANIRRDVIVKSITIPPADAENMYARVNVYPNPVADHATVNITGTPNGAAHITLIDAQGKTHFSKIETLTETGQFSGEIDLDDLRSGLYYMQVRMKDKSFSETMMITD